jgi:hypothetical protein
MGTTPYISCLTHIMIAYQPHLYSATDLSKSLKPWKPLIFTHLDTGGAADKIHVECVKRTIYNIWNKQNILWAVRLTRHTGF